MSSMEFKGDSDMETKQMLNLLQIQSWIMQDFMQLNIICSLRQRVVL